MGRYRFFLALAAAALATAAPAQTPQQLEALAKEIEAERVRIGIPGVALAIVKDDRIVFARGFGLRDVERKLPVTPDTLFAIGSSTKAFTAATVLMAVDASRVGLEDSPKTYLPYFKMRDPETDAKITVRDLLRHNSGLPRTDLMMMAGTGTLNRQDMIRVACAAKPTARLGEKFQYQNIMFSAAGEVAATTLGGSYEHLVQKRIFAPLGMKRANLAVIETLKDPDHATGYNLDDDAKTTAALPMRALDPVAAAGAINASANEMTRWVRLMLGEGVFEGKRLLSARSFTEMTSRQMGLSKTVGYGLGWFLREWKGHKVVEHGGNIDGFNASVAFMPDQKLGFVLLTNVSASPLGQGAQAIVWKNLVPAPADTPAPVPTGPVTEVPPADEVGVYSLAEAPLQITVAFADGKLTATIPGQPTYTLEKVSGRRYKLTPLPEGFFATFRASARDPKKAELVTEQPGATAVFTRETAAAYTAPFSGQELLAKVLEAVGGATNLKRHRTRHVVADVEFENQGMNGRAESWAQIPNRVSSRIDLTAAGRAIGWMEEWFDGKRGGQVGSFLPRTPYPASMTPMLKATADFYDGLVSAPLSFEKVTILKTETVGDAPHGIAPEECYLVELKPWGASAMKWYVSTKTFRVVRRDAVTREYLGDYRQVDGVWVPFLSVVETAADGTLVSRTRRVEHDGAVEPGIFDGPK